MIRRSQLFAPSDFDGILAFSGGVLEDIPSVTRYGTSGHDVLEGLGGDDYLYGLAGNDILNGNGGNDLMAGGTGNDTYYVDSLGDVIWEWGGEGIDTVYASVDNYTLASGLENLFLTDSAYSGTGNEQDNYIVGTAANNALYGLAGNDTLDGGAGIDVMAGGIGGDTYLVDDLGDVVWEWDGQGIDTVVARIDYDNAMYLLPTNVEHLQMAGAAAFGGYGNELDNIMVGNEAANALHGGIGNDTLLGQGGRDILAGDAGADTLYGGTGPDQFEFFWVGDSGPLGSGSTDIIADFSAAEGDMIELSGMDANSNVAGDQAFTFIGNAGFSGAPGEINYTYSGGNTIIQLQTDSDPDVDGAIIVMGLHDPNASWFHL
jgi:Ca2+-binding RTX toxin-like protein